MVGHKVIPRTRKNFPREFHYPLYWWDQLIQYKFCPRAIWLNVWTSRAKNTFIDLGIRIYLCAFQTDVSVHLEALMLAWGRMGGNTGLTTRQKQASGGHESSSPVHGELTPSGCGTSCWMQEAHSSARGFYREMRGRSQATGAARINVPVSRLPEFLQTSLTMSTSLACLHRDSGSLDPVANPTITVSEWLARLPFVIISRNSFFL